MKNLLLIVLFGLSGYGLNAQIWNSVGSYGAESASNLRIGIGMPPQSPSTLFDMGGKFYMKGLQVMEEGSIVFTPSAGTLAPLFKFGQQTSIGGLSNVAQTNDGVILASQVVHMQGVNGVSLNVGSGSYTAQVLYANGSGNVGVGTVTPQARLHVKTTSDNGSSGSNNTEGILIENNGFQTHDFALRINTAHNDVFTVGNKGHVHIGPGLNYAVPGGDNFYLYVAKGIRTERVKVDLAIDNGWADEVFDDNYYLKPLSEVALHIESFGHLPGVPSEEELKCEGIDVAQMMEIQMKKIEELTLYVIELEKKIKKLENDRK